MHIILFLFLFGNVVRFAFCCQKYAYLTTLIPAILSVIFGVLSKTIALHGSEALPLFSLLAGLFATGSLLSGILCRISHKK